MPGFEGTLKAAKALAKCGIWTPCEWHHCSGYYNEVDFYDPEDLNEFDADQIERALELAQPKLEKNYPRITSRGPIEAVYHWMTQERLPPASRSARDPETTSQRTASLLCSIF